MELNQFRNVDVVLDKANDNFIQRQFVSAGDKDGRSLTVQLTDNGVIGEIIGATLNLYWHNQASGLTDLSAFYVVDRATSVFKIDYPQNMLTPGKVIAYIQILHGGKVTHTKPFEITVQKLAGTTRGVLATAEYGALVTTLAKANEFETDIAEVTAQLAQTKLDKADKTTVDDLNVRMNDVIQSADLDPNKDQEVVDARHGAATLGTKLGDMINRLDEADGSMENLVWNGNFQDDSNADGVADSFTITSGRVVNLANGIQSFIPESRYDMLASSDVISNGASKYYFTALVKSNKNTTQLRINSPTTLFKNHSGSGDFERLSVIGVGANTNGVFRVLENGIDTFSEISVKEMMVINLDIFDSEPTIGQMDKIVELHGGWFGGRVKGNVTQKAFVNAYNETEEIVGKKIEEVTSTVKVSGGNIYRKGSHFIFDKYSGTDGLIKSGVGWGLAQIPVDENKLYSVLLPNHNNYTGSVGSVSFHSDEGLVSYLYPASDNINGQFNGSDYITVEIPQGATTLNVTVKAPNFDESETLVVIEGDEITDSTIESLLLEFYGAKVNPLEDFPYEGKVIACLGDSLTEKNATAPINYVDLIAERLGFDARNFGDSGTGYMRTHADGTAFYQRAVNLPADADIITIFGSGNDLAHFANLGTKTDVFDDANKTIAGCINHTIDIIQTNHPRAQLGIIAPTPWATVPTTTGNQMSAYVDLLESICKSRGIPFLNLYRISNLRPWESANNALFFYNSDGTHPNSDGHELFIYPPIRQFIKTLI